MAYFNPRDYFLTLPEWIRYPFRRMIAPLRDEGVIIASCSRGYKIPISVQDIITYLNQTHSIVSLTLHGVDVCRTLVLQGTEGNLDILNDAAFCDIRNILNNLQST